MTIWEHDGRLYEYDSGYHVEENAWLHELTGLSAPASVVVSVPDASPGDAAFTAGPSDGITLRFSDGSVPWPIWTTFMSAVHGSANPELRALPHEPGPADAATQYLLVLQWTVTTEDDFDALLDLESALEASLPPAHGDVDGHDHGSGEMNLFVFTTVPFEAFKDAHAALSGNARWAQVRAAYRPVDEDGYVVLWPPTLERFEVA